MQTRIAKTKLEEKQYQFLSHKSYNKSERKSARKKENEAKNKTEEL